MESKGHDGQRLSCLLGEADIDTRDTDGDDVASLPFPRGISLLQRITMLYIPQLVFSSHFSRQELDLATARR